MSINKLKSSDNNIELIKKINNNLNELNDNKLSLSGGKVTGTIEATKFKGPLEGNAKSASMIYSTLTDSSEHLAYHIPYYTGSNSESKNLIHGDSFIIDIQSGTTSNSGTCMLQLGNNIPAGTVRNKCGVLRLYSDSKGYVNLKPSINTNNFDISLPASSGTIALISSNVASATKLATARTITIEDATATNVSKSVSFDGSANITLKLPNLLDVNIQGTSNTTKTQESKSAGEDVFIPFCTNPSLGYANLKYSNGIKLYTQYGTESRIGHSNIILGNSSAANTEGNNSGALYMYGSGSGVTRIRPSDSNENFNIYFPAKAGTIALTDSDITGNAKTATTANVANKVSMTAKDPTSGTWFAIPFLDNSGTTRNVYGNSGIRYFTLEGTTSSYGRSLLQLGNNTSTGAAGNKRGELRIYSEKAGYIDLLANFESTSANEVTFPTETGIVQLKPITLYNNASGTNGTITLSESASNFQYIEIYFYSDNASRQGYTKVTDLSNYKYAQLTNPITSTSALYMYMKKARISNTSILQECPIYVNTFGTTINTDTTDNIKITKVVGYK